MQRNRIRRQRRVVRRRADELDRIYEGQAYIIDGEAGGRNQGISLYCAYRDRWRCSGRGVVYNDNFRLTQSHNHPADEYMEPVDIFLHELCICCTRQLRSLNDIYDSLEPIHSEAISRLDYDSIREKMRRWRRDMEFPNINSYVNLHEKLTGDYSSFLWCRNGHLHVDIYGAGSPSEVITLTDMDLIRSLGLPSITAIVVVSSTAINSSLLEMEEMILVSVISDNYAYPCIWCFIESSSEAAYSAIVGKILQIFQNAELPVYTNYENKMYNALILVFQMVKGTFYEFITILSSMAHQFDFDELEMLDVMVMKKVCSLALIPAEKIIQTYQQLCRQLTAGQKQRMAGFLQYFEVNWLLRVGPVEMSVYNDYVRMSDVQRSFRKEIEKFENCSVFEILKVIIQMQEKAQRDASRPGKYWIPRVRSLVQPLKPLKKTWQRYATDDIDEMEVLQCSSFFLSECINDVIHFPELLSNTFEVFVGDRRQVRVLRENEFLEVEEALNEDEIIKEFNPNARRARARAQRNGHLQDALNRANPPESGDESDNELA